MKVLIMRVVLGEVLLAFFLLGPAVLAAEVQGPEEALRALVKANEDKDLSAMARLMAHDADIVSYTIGGRKYVGWPQLERDMLEEFQMVARLEMPIIALKVWTRGEIAWFAMELDYIRYVGSGPSQRRMVFPLRETGVLELRDGKWVLLAWHESFRDAERLEPVADQVPCAPTQKAGMGGRGTVVPNLSGEWEVQEEDKSYKAVLDGSGNGSYSWQSGRIMTTVIAGQKWQGTWHQSGNDREGGFELVLSEDGLQAKGVWWYSRVGEKSDIPPRQWGGSYVWKRTSAGPTSGNVR
jgi:SnoaL-like protein